MDIASLISHLQDLELPDDELNELVGALTTEGLTEPVRRRVRAVLVRSMNQDVAKLERYESARDDIRKHDQSIERIMKRGEQALNRIDMRTKATLQSIERHVKEDVAAASAGATLLLHTDEVAPASQPVEEPLSQLSPKQAASIVIEAQRPSQPVSPISAPASPISPSLPTNEPLPATMAPLPPTPIAPAVTEPATA